MVLVGVGETENQALHMWQTENTAAAVKSSQLQSAAAGILCSAGVRNEREACQAAELISLSLKELKRPHPANCPDNKVNSCFLQCQNGLTIARV